MRISDWSSDVCSSDLPARDHLGVAAARTFLGAGGHEQFGVGVRRDDGADVAPVEHRAAGLVREIDLALEQRRTDLRVDRRADGEDARALEAQRRVLERAGGKIAGGVRKRVVKGKRGSVRVELVGSRLLNKKI